MSRITKLELEQRLAAANQELCALRLELSTALADKKRLERELWAERESPCFPPADPVDPPFDALPTEQPAPQSVAPATKVVAVNRYHKVLPARPAWQPSAQMLAARDLAMRTGRSVKVARA